MLFSFSKSHYFEIEGKTATWLPKLLDKFQCHEICDYLALAFHFWINSLQSVQYLKNFPTKADRRLSYDIYF